MVPLPGYYEEINVLLDLDSSFKKASLWRLTGRLTSSPLFADSILEALHSISEQTPLDR